MNVNFYKIEQKRSVHFWANIGIGTIAIHHFLRQFFCALLMKSCIGIGKYSNKYKYIYIFIKYDTDWLKFQNTVNTVVNKWYWDVLIWLDQVLGLKSLRTIDLQQSPEALPVLQAVLQTYRYSEFPFTNLFIHDLFKTLGA